MQLSLISESCGLRRASENWFYSRDGDEFCRQIFHRHYSHYKYKDGRIPKLFVGPGQKTILITEYGDALWVWRKFVNGDGQQGVNCAVFRNEGDVLSSTLILEAEQVACVKWPGERFYTYVNPHKIRSSNPGACFKFAGWRVCGRTKWKGLIILEKHQPQKFC